MNCKKIYIYNKKDSSSANINKTKLKKKKLNLKKTVKTNCKN